MLHGSRRVVAFAGLAACSLLLTGCWTEGGRGYSNDSYTYVSREWEPKTISVIDTRTGQAMWSYEIPVGRQLMMEFFADASENPSMPDRMRWADRKAGTTFGDLDNKIDVPSSSVRRVDMKLRPVPETGLPAPVAAVPAVK
ncbi:MAG: hypothetical protein ACKVS8_05595 [Phycisphaerales bacterium]